MHKLSINSLSRDALADLVISCSQPKYRANQVFRWLHGEKCKSFDEMTNLPAAFRNALAEVAEITTIAEISRVVSKRDGSMKLLYQLSDGERVEAVLLKDRDRVTACISTQVGCRMGCRFCATAHIGFKRNLSAAEIVAQVDSLEKVATEIGITENGRLSGIVVMGMGEPLDNFNAVKTALDILHSEDGYSYSHRRITLSTAGVVPKLKELFAMESPVNLAVSLNAPDEVKRRDIMPISAKHSLSEVMNALRQLPLQKRKRITLEYVLLGGFNDSVMDARKLVKLVAGLPVKINLIRYNGGGDEDLKTPRNEDVLAFQEILTDSGLTAFIRKSLGADIFGACGQLSANYNA
jgi:23S rRNA (adenine2503-C2)-methyltransferase